MDRIPDSYYTEQLVQQQLTISSEDDVERCLQLSMVEYIEQSILNQETKYTELYSKYKTILLKYKKLNQYDSTIRDFTSYIEPIVDEYCKHSISIELDEESYLNIINIIQSIRLTTEEKELMFQLFSKY
jgi:hypothetical protein